METFGRGCLYLILGVVGLIVFVVLTGSRITIPWFIHHHSRFLDRQYKKQKMRGNPPHSLFPVFRASIASAMVLSVR